MSKVKDFLIDEVSAIREITGRDQFACPSVGELLELRKRIDSVLNLSSPPPVAGSELGRLCACSDCGRQWREMELHDIEDIFQRVGAGEKFPAGQCPIPDCGALCHLTDEPPKAGRVIAGKHTPGPWTVDADDCDQVLEPISGFAIHSTFCGMRFTPQERAANARLIAAAPELLEACKGLLANAPEPKRINKDYSYILYRETARKAISKAEGR